MRVGIRIFAYAILIGTFPFMVSPQFGWKVHDFAGLVALGTIFWMISWNFRR
jgi:hypothetical protein